MNKIELIVFGSQLVNYPLPKPLTKLEIIKGAAILNESCFPSDEGKDFLRKINVLGYTALSFPDGTRLAYIKHGGGNLTMDEGVAVYQRARKMVGEKVEALASACEQTSHPKGQYSAFYTGKRPH